MEVHHFAKPHGVHKAVKSNATRSEVACSRKRLFPTFGIVNEACIFAHFHRYEAHARAGRWVKSGGPDIARRHVFPSGRNCEPIPSGETRVPECQRLRGARAVTGEKHQPIPYNGFLPRNMLIGGGSSDRGSVR